MRIPADAGERQSFYAETLQDCLVSLEARRSTYRDLRRYYMYGCGPDGDPSTTVNKIYPHIDQLCSFMYSQETTIFNIEIGQSESEGELTRVRTVGQKVNDEWHDSNCDIIFGVALQWAFVYGSMFIKTRRRGNGTESFIVEPHNFGVLREDVTMLSRQEAFAMCYMQTKSELERELRIANHPRIDDILKHVVESGSPANNQGTMIGNIVVSSVTPQILGNVNLNLSSLARYQPRVAKPLVKMHELYVWNDAINDFQIVTMAENIVVYDRPLEEMLLEDEPPFVQVCPSPAEDYFWGHSEVERLIPLQEMRNERMMGIRQMMKRQERPPKSFGGFPAVTDEINATFDTPGGYAQSDIPGAKVEPFSPDIPEDLFREVRELDLMFEEMSGISNILSGRGETGVRSEGHANKLAELGSARAKKRALVIEDCLEKQATLMLRIMQKYNKEQFKDEEGAQFILNQFTKNCIVRVDAHSNSPIFVENTVNLAFELFKAQAIDKEELLRIVPVPMKQSLINKLKTKIEPAQAAAAQAENVIKMQKPSSKSGPAQ